jgi:hypothetical protein
MTTPLAAVSTAPSVLRRELPERLSTVLAAVGRELRAWMVLGIVSLPFTVWLTMSLPDAFGVFGFVAAYLGGGAVVRGGVKLAGVAGGRGLLAFLLPSGEAVRPGYAHSREQAMAARGDVAGAIGEYERRLAYHPGDVGARLRLAELYARRGDADHAAELLRALRRLPDVTAEQDVAASNRLIDLYVGPLGEPGRAMVELRRLAECYPATRMGAEAREALARMKAATAAVR